MLIWLYSANRKRRKYVMVIPYEWRLFHIMKGSSKIAILHVGNLSTVGDLSLSVRRTEKIVRFNHRSPEEFEMCYERCDLILYEQDRFRNPNYETYSLDMIMPGYIYGDLDKLYNNTKDYTEKYGGLYAPLDYLADWPTLEWA